MRCNPCIIGSKKTFAPTDADEFSIRRADTGIDYRYPFFAEKKKASREIPRSLFMPLAGLEPARCYPLDFESSASANSATVAYAFARETSYHTLETDARSFCIHFVLR